MKRLTDTEIWDEDWFIDLPNEYKLFFLYIKDRCDHSGMWRPNRRKFSMIVHGKTMHYDEFLIAVNKDEEKVKNRIIVLDNGKWFLTKFISFQCGKVFRPKIGAHRGAFKLLISNNIHPRDVPDIDWLGLQNLDFEELKKLGHGSTLYSLNLEDGVSKVALIEKEIDPENRTRNKDFGKSENLFKLQHLYDRAWNQVDTTTDRQFKGVTEQSFAQWRRFVDMIVEKEYTEVFKALFVHPSDFNVLVTKHGFTEDLWEPVIKKMLSTGIKPEQNLYFRIPDYMKGLKSIVNQSNKSGMNAGDSNLGEMRKW